jgi:hypothetical protein
MVRGLKKAMDGITERTLSISISHFLAIQSGTFPFPSSGLELGCYGEWNGTGFAFDSTCIIEYFQRGGDETRIVQRSRMIPAWRKKTRTETLHRKWWDVLANAQRHRWNAVDCK